MMRRESIEPYLQIPPAAEEELVRRMAELAAQRDHGAHHRCTRGNDLSAELGELSPGGKP